MARLTRSQRLTVQYGVMPALAPERHLSKAFLKAVRRATCQPGRYDDADPCCWCGLVRTEKERGHEHVIPKSKGGVDGWVNTVPACHRCNNPRGSYSVPLWLLALMNTSGDPALASKWVGATLFRREREAAAQRKAVAAAAALQTERQVAAAQADMRARRAQRALRLVLAAQDAGELNLPSRRARW
jgi:hypothetical protein